jgi:coatomer subunit delta
MLPCDQVACTHTVRLLTSDCCAVLVSRQYVEMNRIRVEGLLAAFPKLVGTGKQHTYVETENVRYVYQPMEGLYLLLITNKQSNILEDLETLRLLSKVVREYVEDVSEVYVCEHAFELLFAFDEVISLGHKEEVTVAQVRQNTEMDSNEEKLINMIKGEKIKQANETMNVRAREIERDRVERTQRGDPFRTATALSSRAETSTASLVMDDGPSFAPSPSPSGFGSKAAPPARSGPSKGMKLSKDKKKDLLSVLEEDGVVSSSGGGLAPPSAPVPVLPTDPVNVSIEERLCVKMNKEGGLQSMEVQGTLVLLCTDEQAAFVQVVLKTGPNEGFQFKTHPNIDKGLYSLQHKLGVKDPARPFPINVPQGVLKWRYQTSDEARVPLTVNCWPTPSGSETYLNIEYESAASYDLQRVEISVPGTFCGLDVLGRARAATCYASAVSCSQA